METVIYEKHIPKYTYDTASTFRERIAERFNTIPGWVNIEEPTNILVKEMEDEKFTPALVDRSKFDLDWKEFLLVWLNAKLLKSTIGRQFLRPQFQIDLKGANVSDRDAAEILEILFDREKTVCLSRRSVKKLGVIKNGWKHVKGYFKHSKPMFLPFYLLFKNEKVSSQ